MRVALHDALEQNYQLQNELEEQILKHREQEKRNAELHVKLLEEKEKLTAREQENSMSERRVKELSGEVERTHMLQLERVLTCVSESSKDAPQSVAGEDNSQILTETQQEFAVESQFVRADVCLQSTNDVVMKVQQVSVWAGLRFGSPP